MSHNPQNLIVGRNSQRIRQWQLLRLLSVNRMTTLQQIADKFQVSKKTARRDLACLEESGFPIIYQGDDDKTRGRGFIRLEHSFANAFAQLRELRP